MVWLDHLLLVRISVTMNEVYSLKCLLEFVSLSQLLQLNAIAKERDETRRAKYRRMVSSNQPVQSWSAKVFIDESAKWWEDFSGKYQHNQLCERQKTFYAICVVDGLPNRKEKFWRHIWYDWRQSKRNFLLMKNPQWSRKIKNGGNSSYAIFLS